MQYNGGKQSVGKVWARLINDLRPKVYREPFCGMLGVGRHVKADRRVFSDSDPAVIAVLKAVQRGWTPPSTVSENEYYRIKETNDPENPVYGFVAFGCSFGGKRWGGYARDPRKSLDFADAAKRALASLRADMASTDEFLCCSYLSYPSTAPHVVYCDPPYQGTTRVGISGFNTTKFISWCESLPVSALFVSEYFTSPGPQWVPVYGSGLTNNLRGKRKTTVEKLYRVYPAADKDAW